MRSEEKEEEEEEREEEEGEQVPLAWENYGQSQRVCWSSKKNEMKSKGIWARMLLERVWVDEPLR